MMILPVSQGETMELRHKVIERKK